jgi:site-specific DNA-cytosine methylase
MILVPRETEIRHFHLFCGLGGGAKGMNLGRAQVGHVSAKFRCIGGVDNDRAAIRDFTRLAGVQGTVLDLFSREQYVAFHGEEPPDGWREATPEDIRRAAHYERPHIGFGSAPCKGFSGLLSESKSKTDKYAALNQLALRGLRLALEAWADDPLEFWLWENVPRIATRGRPILDQMIALLADFGYAVSETTHDCGELGELAQTRKRFLLVARHRDKVPPFLYEPRKRRVRGVGEVIGRLPVPGPDVTLPMHRLPMLQWQTWVRLAFVEAGSDWRSLNRLQVHDGVLRDFALVPARDWNHGALGVRGWTDPSTTVTANGRPAAGAFSVADPRIDGHEKSIQHGVGSWQTPAAVVKGDVSVGTGRYAVADPRMESYGEHYGKMRVEDWQDASHTVTGSDRVGSGAMSVADPRYASDDKWTEGRRGLGVLNFEDTAGAVTSQAGPGQGAYSVADPRLDDRPRFSSVYKIVRWNETAPAVTGNGGPAMGVAVADPRTGYKDAAHRNKFAVQEWQEPGATVTGADHVTGGAMCVADPRVSETRYGSGRNGVLDWEQSAGTIAGESLPSNGKFAVADPRPPQGSERTGKGKYRVTGSDEPAGCVIAASTTGNGAFAVADPRPIALRDGKSDYKTAGEYGVVPWDSRAGTVAAAARHDNGRWTVADPRAHHGDALSRLPGSKDRLIAVIQALDGTYHRPFTTLELAFLQSLFSEEELTALVAAGTALEGGSDSAWRERIGNAVPPHAARAVADVMGTTLLLAWAGETFLLSDTPIWVRPKRLLEIAVTLDAVGVYE